MAVITFTSNLQEENGKTMSLVAIATYLAIQKNKRVLIISTTNKYDKIKNCYFEEQETKKKFGVFAGAIPSSLETESGIQGLVKILRSNKLSPNMITNYTKVVFKNRLEVLLGSEEINESLRNEKSISEEYIDIISAANQYYDIVLVDLDFNVQENIRKIIINNSNLVILNTSQRLKAIQMIKNDEQINNLFKLKKTLVMIGKYDKNSKYNSKNIARYLETKKKILAIPYNTLYFEAVEEAKVPDMFLKLGKMSDLDDENNIFINYIKEATESIIYKLQELQITM